MTFHPFGAAVLLLTFVQCAAALAIGFAGIRAKASGAAALFVAGSAILATTLCAGGPFGDIFLGNFASSPSYDLARDVVSLLDLVAVSIGLACVAGGVWRSTSSP